MTSTKLRHNQDILKAKNERRKARRESGPTIKAHDGLLVEDMSEGLVSIRDFSHTTRSGGFLDWHISISRARELRKQLKVAIERSEEAMSLVSDDNQS